MRAEKGIKRLLYCVLVGILALPYLQKNHKLFVVKELKGSFEKKDIKVPALQFKSYRSEDFQRKFTEKNKEELGLKNWFIRIYNQVNYSLFNVANSRGVIVTDNNVMIPEGYIKSYLGVDFVGRENIERMVKKAKLVQDSLGAQNKAFFFLIVPGKVAVYPELIPQHYHDSYKTVESNYDALKDLLKQYQVNFLDLRKFIVENKSQFKYPIFPSKGVHWSGNTVAVATDTLLAYVQNHLKKEVQQIYLSKGEETIRDYRYTDYDIGESMNLLWFSSNDKLHYPTINYEKAVEKKPALFGTGDSFLESFFGFYDIFDSTFSENSRLWFYNRTLDWPKKYHDFNIDVKRLDLEVELRNKDIVMIETSDENIRMLGYKLVDDLYDVLTYKNPVPVHLEADYQRLLNDPDIIQQARDLHGLMGYTEEEMRKSLAQFELEKLSTIDLDFDKEVQKYILQIKDNKEWLENIKKQAIQKNISLEQNIKENAIWMVNEQLGRN